MPEMNHRDSTASHISLASLQQLDPSPIDSPYDDEKQFLDNDDTNTTPSPPARSSTLGLSGNGYGSVYYCKQANAR